VWNTVILSETVELYVPVPVEQLFQAVHRNDVVGLKWLLEGNGCKNLLDKPESNSELSLLMTAALAGKTIVWWPYVVPRAVSECVTKQVTIYEAP